MRTNRSCSAAFFARRYALLAAVTALALTGCRWGDDKREDIVKCSGFTMGLMMSGSTLTPAMQAALTKAGITPGDTLPLAGAAQKYASTMEPAKVTRLAQEGSASATDFLRKKDAEGIAGYLKDCVATYKDLGS